MEALNKRIEQLLYGSVYSFNLERPDIAKLRGNTSLAARVNVHAASLFEAEAIIHALQDTLKQVREECRYSHSMAINGMASHRDCVSGSMSKALALIDAAVGGK